MNRIAFVCFMWLSALAVWSQNVNTSLRIDKAVHDFGTIDEAAGKVSHSFRLTNVGKDPVTILYVRSGCNCVKAEAPRAPIAPGASANLTVTYDPANRAGNFYKEVSIVAADKRFNKVQIKGTVKPRKKKTDASLCHDLGHGLLANHDQLDFGRMGAGQEKTLELRFVNDFPVGLKLSFEIEKADPTIDVVIPYSCILAPDGEDRLRVTVRVRQAFSGTKKVMLIPVGNDYRLSPVEIIVNGK